MLFQQTALIVMYCGDAVDPTSRPSSKMHALQSVHADKLSLLRIESALLGSRALLLYNRAQYMSHLDS